jgi:hypothetical protein
MSLETSDAEIAQIFTRLKIGEAAVREASKRTIGLRHYDVQIIGGAALHGGSISEMRTGEGKTLVATMPIYLNALTGRGVHLITVNDYLARRDARWMAPIYPCARALSVGVLQMAAVTENGKKAFIVDFERESPQEDQHHLSMVDRVEAYGRISPLAPTPNSVLIICVTTWQCALRIASSAGITSPWSMKWIMC